jgi:hypothetical protein
MSSKMLCYIDGKVCTGKVVAGAPTCEVSSFDDSKDSVVYRCPRFKPR